MPLVEGVPVQVRRDDGTITGDQVRLIDFDDPDANDWLVVNQFTVIENKTNRRPDVMIFVNGLHLGDLELKNPGDENATIESHAALGGGHRCRRNLDIGKSE